MAEWPMWPGGAHARVAYVAERLAWPIGFTNLTRGAHNFAEVTHFRALSKFVRAFVKVVNDWPAILPGCAAGSAAIGQPRSKSPAKGSNFEGPAEYSQPKRYKSLR